MQMVKFHLGVLVVSLATIVACNNDSSKSSPPSGKSTTASNGKVDASGMPALSSISCSNLQTSNCAAMGSTMGKGNAALSFSITSSPLQPKPNCAYLTASSTTKTMSILMVGSDGFQLTPPFKYLNNGAPVTTEQYLDKTTVGTNFGSPRYSTTTFHQFVSANGVLNMASFTPGGTFTLKFAIKTEPASVSGVANAGQTNVVSGCISGTLPTTM